MAFAMVCPSVVVWGRLSTLGISHGSGFFVSGGTLPLESESYVERDCDRALFEALHAGKYCYVLNSRQMGKSSLSIRTLARLEREGRTAISLDLTQMGGRNVTAEQWYLGMAAELGRSVGLRSQVLAYCRENAGFGPMRRFFGAIREVLLETLEGPIVICIDEIDATRNLAFDADEFFAGIRECFNRRAQDPAFHRLTFCLLGVAVPSDLIRNPGTTPFNVGERVYLRDFSLAEVQPLARALGPNGEALVQRVHYWTQGHPFLTQSLCAAIAADVGIQSAPQVDALVETEMFGPKARDRNINLADVANRALNAGAAEPDPERFRADLLSAYERIRAGKPLPDDESNRVASLLKLSGLVRSDDMRLRVRNRIYERVFDREWIQENMPGQELRRQRQSYRRGLIRATAISGTVLVTVAALAVAAWRSQNRAEAATAALDREMYVAAMNSLRVFEMNGDIGRIAETLERTRTSPHRGIEWGLWQNQVHDAKEEYTLDFFAPGKRELGLLSLDGRRLCLVDEVTSTATLIDRATGDVAGTQRIRPRQVVVPYDKGFYLFDPAQRPPTVTDLETMRELGTLDERPEPVTNPVARPDSSIVAVHRAAGEGDWLELWDLSSRRQLAQFGGPGSRFEVPAVFSADGRRVAFSQRSVAEVGDGGTPPFYTIQVRETESGRKIDAFTMPGNGILLDFSADGSRLLYSDGANTSYGRDVDRHRNVYRRSGMAGEAPVAARFSPRGNLLATLDRSGRLITESFPAGRLLATHSNVWGLSGISPAEELVASATSVRIFDVRSGSGAPVLGLGQRIGRDQEGNFVLFQPDRPGLQRLDNVSLKVKATETAPQGLRGYTYNGGWRVWTDARTRQTFFQDTFSKLPPRRVPHPFANFSGGLSLNTFAILSGRTNEIVGLAGDTGREKWRYRLPEASNSGLWVSPDGRNVLAFVGVASVLVLDAERGTLRDRLDRHNLRINNLIFTADGKGFFTCGLDGRAILWDLATLGQRMQFQGNVAHGITCADLSADGRRVVTGNDAGAWQLWDAVTGVQLAEMRGGFGPVRSVMFTADGRKILAASDDGKIRFWESVEADPSIRIPVSQSRRSTIRK